MGIINKQTHVIEIMFDLSINIRQNINYIMKMVHKTENNSVVL